MTIVLSVSFKSATDTQVTKLEEESQKALSAAESAIEVALKNDSTATLGPNGSNELSTVTGFEGTATIESLSSPTFTTPNVARDSAYTFYLGAYSPTTKTITSSNVPTITICFDSEAALDITLVKANSVKKYVVDPQSRINNSLAVVPCTMGSMVTISSTDINAGATDSKFIIVRVLYNTTKLLFSSVPSTPLPVQGRTITSQATSSTSTGVSKKVILFQSYPQIPADFFVTSF